ncbi:hypothetical protein Ciccas_013814, partial [Cichlidogyrus casuarinus]
NRRSNSIERRASTLEPLRAALNDARFALSCAPAVAPAPECQQLASCEEVLAKPLPDSGIQFNEVEEPEQQLRNPFDLSFEDRDEFEESPGPESQAPVLSSSLRSQPAFVFAGRELLPQKTDSKSMSVSRNPFGEVPDTRTEQKGSNPFDSQYQMEQILAIT